MRGTHPKSFIFILNNFFHFFLPFLGESKVDIWDGFGAGSIFIFLSFL